ncbi:MAG: sulfatase [Verrucomicrobiaceae bacterium]|nr:sulfatase [Verrucomicrobiaceae bacterium]
MKRLWLFLFTLCPSLFAAQPNILFILADDLGWSDLGCYGSSFNETPHLDKLAAQGLRFTQAYTAGAVCSPTRGSIQTGKVPPRTGVTDYIPGLSSAGRKLATRPTNKQLALEEVTVAESLREGGYQTFYAGKWHLGGKGFEPGDQGYEVVVPDVGKNKDWRGGQTISEDAMKFLDERDANRPFFMFLGYHEPHTPILEYPDHITKFRNKAAKLSANAMPRQERDGMTRTAQNDPAYASEVAGLDSFVGSVLDKLDRTGLSKDTIVIFFSDNGGLSTKSDPGPTSNEPLRAGKGWLYEGGIRVPLIVRAPGLTKAGSRSDTLVLSTDFYPTLLSLAGLAARPGQHRDGLDISSVLRGEKALARDALYWHYPHYHGSTWAPGGAMREGDWKLIEHFDEGTVELYNLKSDLSEKANLAQSEPDRLKSMQAKLAAWRKETGAYMPVPGETAMPEKSKKKSKKPKSKR